MDKILDGLVESGFAVVPAFVSSEIVKILKNEMDQLDSAGLFRPAATGRGSGKQVNTDIRGDRIYWLESSHFLIQEFEKLRMALNSGLFLGLNSIECHYAIYPPGGRYQKHLDRHRDSDARVVSVVLYLNELWSEHDGGVLHLFDRDQKDLIAARVVPQSGALACFMSGNVWHEVTETNRPRYSVTGWFRR